VTNEEEERRGAVALVSGGLDSTVAVALSFETFRLERGLFFDYGQHAAREECRCAGRVADRYGMPLERIELPWMARFSRSALIRGRGEPPDPESPDPGDRSRSRAVWVENRNGVFVDIAASIAASIGCGVVITGFNAEEAEDFPDNSERYIDAINRALAFGTSVGVEVVGPTIRMTKGEIVREGLRLGIPWSDLWSCYRSGDAMCGRCESCIRLKNAVTGTAASELVKFERKQG
jgi:7-cyano-7-deazaguanine synthase